MTPSSCYTQLIKQFKQTLPFLFMGTISILNQFFTLTLVGRQSQLDLAACAYISILLGLLYTIASSSLLPISLYITQDCCARKQKNTGAILKDGLLLATLIGLFLSVLVYFLGPLLLTLHQPPAVIQHLIPYFHMTAFSILPFFWSMVGHQFFLGIARTTIIFRITCVTLPLSLLLSVVLINSLGLIGAAYAGLVTIMLQLLLMISCTAINPTLRRYITLPSNWFTFHYLKSLYKIAFPITARRTAGTTVFVILLLLVGQLPHAITALAAQQIAYQYTLLVSVISFSFMQSTSMTVTRSLQANQLQNAIRQSHIAILLSSLCVIAAFLFCELLQPQFTSIFISRQNGANTAIAVLASHLLIVTACLQLFDTVHNMTTTALHSFQPDKSSQRHYLIISWGLGVPLAYYLAFPLQYGALGIVSGITIVMAFQAMLGLLQFHTVTRLRPVANAQTGFTLVELLLVFSLALAILLWSFPSWRTLGEDAHERIVAGRLMYAIDLARSEALQQADTMVLASPSEWQKEFIVYKNAAPKVVLYHFLNDARGILHWRSFPGNKRELQFLASGMTQIENGTFWFCRQSGVKPSWSIVVSKTGRAHLTYPYSAQRVKDFRATSLRC